MPTTRDLYTQLRRRYEPMLSLALATGRARQQTGGCDLEAVACTMTGLADREEQEPHAPCLSPAHLAACRLAAWTFADEVLLNLPDSQWFAHGLQLRRMGRTDGGSTFYQTWQHMADQALQAQLAHVHQDEILLLQPVQAGTQGTFAAAGSSLPASASTAFHDTLSPSFGPYAEAGTASAQPGFLSGAAAGEFSLPRLVRLVQRLAADVSAGEQEAAPNPALAVCAFMATCLLYGFRGCLYAPERAVELESLLAASASLVQQLLPAAPALAGTQGTAVTTGEGQKLARPGLLLLLAAPLLTTAAWYLVCASIINSLTLPWSGQ